VRSAVPIDSRQVSELPAESSIEKSGAGDLNKQKSITPADWRQPKDQPTDVSAEPSTASNQNQNRRIGPTDWRRPKEAPAESPTEPKDASDQDKREVSTAVEWPKTPLDDSGGVKGRSTTAESVKPLVEQNQASNQNKNKRVAFDDWRRPREVSTESDT